jgi:hypothetical protein
MYTSSIETRILNMLKITLALAFLLVVLASSQSYDDGNIREKKISSHLTATLILILISSDRRLHEDYVQDECLFEVPRDEILDQILE